MGGDAAAGDLLAGEDANELFLAAGRVEGGDDDQLDATKVLPRGEGLTQGGDGLGFVVLDGDQARLRLEQVP